MSVGEVDEGLVSLTAFVDASALEEMLSLEEVTGVGAAAATSAGMGNTQSRKYKERLRKVIGEWRVGCCVRQLCVGR